MKFTADEYAKLASIVFQDDYPGYRPDVKEIPNRDGNIDFYKKYAHVATKYIERMAPGPDRDYLSAAYTRALKHARAIAQLLAIPQRLWPAKETSALRVLHYDPGVGSHEHTDFDLFTTLLYRSPNRGLVVDTQGVPVDHINPGMHFGELAFEACDIPATKHKVDPLDEEQHSIVFFAIPPLDAEVKLGQTVGEWLAPRVAAARVDASEVAIGREGEPAEDDPARESDEPVYDRPLAGLVDEPEAVRLAKTGRRKRAKGRK